MRRIGLFAWAALCASFTANPLLADVTLPAIFGDNMVLQQDKKLHFWGKAAVQEEVTVTVGDKSGSAETDKGGNWRVELDPISASGPVTVKIAGKNTIELQNVLVGEVWLASGQSNMEWPMSRATDAKSEIATATDQMIRIFEVEKTVAGEPQTDVVGKWMVCSPESVAEFTAVGYFFARALRESTDRPVGIVQTAWGGTPAEAWTSRGKLEKTELCEPILTRWDEICDPAKQEAAQKEYDKALLEWAKTVEPGKPAPAKPPVPIGPTNPHRASGLYNAMIAPLVPFAVRGAIWYQGESNASRAYQYRTLFPAMIEDWRTAWNDEFPFLFVQLADFMAPETQPNDSAWAELREAQSMTLSLPKTGMATIIDIGEADDIHPGNKQDVGERLALAADKIAYGQDIVFSGPTYKSMEVEGNKIRLHFDNIGGGLGAKYGELEGFAIAGEDHKFVWADAKVDGETIVVSSDQVASPVAVRYGWANNPTISLFNAEGLPASPFRTDDWPGITVDAR